MTLSCDTSRIYWDNAATTPLCEEAACAMQPYMKSNAHAFFGNANSLHAIGREAFFALEDARTKTSSALGAHRPDEVVFTSGATEADNAALIGIALGAWEATRQQGRKNSASRVIMSRIEHDAVLGSAKLLRVLGFEVSFVENDSNGFITPDALERAMGDSGDVALVSIMAANNEVGVIEPVSQLAQCAHEHGALFHTDAVQALGKIPVNVASWNIDAASFSAHKVGGPKGVGVLFLKSKTPFMPLIAGGGQERGLRSGTQNIAGIVGLAAAFDRTVQHQQAFASTTQAVRDFLYEHLTAYPKVTPSVEIKAHSGNFLPHIVNVCVRGCESQTLIMQLDRQGFCVSGGSACSSHSLEPSHVLTALGISRNLAEGSLRISLGEDASLEQAEAFMKVFREVLAQWSL